MVPDPFSRLTWVILLFSKIIRYLVFFNKPLTVIKFNPHTPVAQKIADEVVFWRFQGEGVEFFLIEPHWPPQILDAHVLKNTNFRPSSFHFSVGFNIKILFWVRWFEAYYLLYIILYKKVPIFCRISDESALIHNFLRNGCVRG